MATTFAARSWPSSTPSSAGSRTGRTNLERAADADAVQSRASRGQRPAGRAAASRSRTSTGRSASSRSEIDGVRQREDRDRALLDWRHRRSQAARPSCSTSSRPCSAGSRSLEDSLLEVMERREELHGRPDRRAGRHRRARRPSWPTAAAARDEALAEIDAGAHRARCRAAMSSSPRLDADLVALYERQRAPCGRRCGSAAGPALRCVPHRDRPRRAGADRRRCRRRGAALPGVSRNPVAGRRVSAMKVVVEADGGSRGNPGPAGYGAVVLSADRAHGAGREQGGHRPGHQQCRRVPRPDRRPGGGGRARRHRGRGRRWTPSSSSSRWRAAGGSSTPT